MTNYFGVTNEQIIDQQLHANGFHRAADDERGWYVLVMVDGEIRRIWATGERRKGMTPKTTKTSRLA